MAKQFFYQLMGEVFGPMTGVELRAKATEGVVCADTLVRVGDDGEWVLATRLKHLFDSDEQSTVREVVSPPVQVHRTSSEQKNIDGWKQWDELVSTVSSEEATPTTSSPPQPIKPQETVAYRVERYSGLGVYGSLCIAFGIIGLIIAMLVSVSAILSAILGAQENESVGVLFYLMFIIGISSFGLLALGNAIRAFIDLVQDTRRTLNVLERIASRLEERRL